VSELVGSGLLEEMRAEKVARYKISPKGIQFLFAYSHFEEFTQSFGLRL
jgi:predicted transcriptional regulator